MSFKQTLVIALCTAGSTALLAWLGQLLIAYLQRRNERAKYFREKLLERYSEFAAVTAVGRGPRGGSSIARRPGRG